MQPKVTVDNPSPAQTLTRRIAFPQDEDFVRSFSSDLSLRMPPVVLCVINNTQAPFSSLI